MMMHMPDRTGDLVPGPWSEHPKTGGAGVDDTVGWINPELVEDDESPPTPSHFLTHPEAAEILRVRTGTVASMVHRGELTPVQPHKAAQLNRDEVERVAARRAIHRPNPYFVTGKEAAEILGVNRQRVDQLAADGRLPYVETGVARPRRLYRRAQIEVIASGRSGTRARATNAIAERPNE
jgi:excisionase family DNA binding protein